MSDPLLDTNVPGNPARAAVEVAVALLNQAGKASGLEDAPELRADLEYTRSWA